MMKKIVQKKFVLSRFMRIFLIGFLLVSLALITYAASNKEVRERIFSFAGRSSTCDQYKVSIGVSNYYSLSGNLCDSTGKTQTCAGDTYECKSPGSTWTKKITNPTSCKTMARDGNWQINLTVCNDYNKGKQEKCSGTTYCCQGASKGWKEGACTTPRESCDVNAQVKNINDIYILNNENCSTYKTTTCSNGITYCCPGKYSKWVVGSSCQKVDDVKINCTPTAVSNKGYSLNGNLCSEADIVAREATCLGSYYCCKNGGWTKGKCSVATKQDPTLAAKTKSLLKTTPKNNNDCCFGKGSRTLTVCAGLDLRFDILGINWGSYSIPKFNVFDNTSFKRVCDKPGGQAVDCDPAGSPGYELCCLADGKWGDCTVANLKNLPKANLCSTCGMLNPSTEARCRETNGGNIWQQCDQNFASKRIHCGATDVWCCTNTISPYTYQWTSNIGACKLAALPAPPPGKSPAKVGDKPSTQVIIQNSKNPASAKKGSGSSGSSPTGTPKACNDFACASQANGANWNLINCGAGDPDGDVQTCDGKGRIGTCQSKQFCCPGQGQKWTETMTACQTTKAVLTVKPATITAGQNLTVTWSGIPGASKFDWIGMYKQGETDQRKSLDWFYVKTIAVCQKDAGDGKPSGTCAFKVPTTALSGTYELRLFSNNTFSKIATSNTFTVNAITLATLSVTPATVSAGLPLSVTWSNITSPTTTDWIGLYKEGEAEDKNSLDWYYLVNGSTCVKTTGDGKSGGTCSFTVPAVGASGNFELRLFTSNTFSRLAVSNIFTITGAVNPTPSGACCPCVSPTPYFAPSACNGPCMTSANCPTNQVCLLAASYGWVCRNPACVESSSCGCTGGASLITPTPQAEKVYCDEECTSSTQCESGYRCVYAKDRGTNVCRNPKCTSSQTCYCPTITPTIITKGTEEDIASASSTPMASSAATPTPFGFRLNALPSMSPTPSPIPINPLLTVKPFTDQAGKTASKFTLTGTTDPFTEVEIRIDPDAVGQTTTADTKGNWRYILTKSLSPGNKQLTVTARGTGGGETQIKQSFTAGTGGGGVFASIFMALLVLAGLGGLGYFIYTKQKNDQSALFSQFPPIQSTGEEAPTEEPSSESKPDLPPEVPLSEPSDALTFNEPNDTTTLSKPE